MSKIFYSKMLPLFSFVTVGLGGVAIPFFTPESARGADAIARCSTYSYDEVLHSDVNIVCQGSKKDPNGYFVINKKTVHGRLFKKGDDISIFTSPATAADFAAAGVQVTVGGSASAGAGSGTGASATSTGSTSVTGRNYADGTTDRRRSGTRAAADEVDTTYSTTRTVTRTRVMSAKARAGINVDIVNEHCGPDGNLIGYDEVRTKVLEGIKEDLKKFKECPGDSCLATLQGTMQDAYSGCHSDCLNLALDDKGACAWKNLTSSFRNANEFCATLMKNDQSPRLDEFKKLIAAATNRGQDTCEQYSTANTDAGSICKALTTNDKCLEVVKDESFACAPLRDAAIAYYAAKKEHDDLENDRKKLEGPSSSSCKVESVASVQAAFLNRDKVSIKCLIDIENSCEDALNKANKAYDAVAVEYRPFCPTCNIDSNLTSVSCMYGGQCSGVSKAAQILGKIGDFVVPLGLGAMNMAMYNKGLNSCVAAYTLQVQQAQQVGLPPQNSNCGGGGFAMGGFGGGGMMGIPGMMGGGMMGMPGMMGGGMMGMPGMGIGANLGFGMGMPGMMGGGGMMGMPGMMGGGGMMGMPGMMGGGGMMGANLGQMQSNLYSVQQQMYDAQSRMQQMAAQNMIVQQSAYSGMGLGGQFGMGTPYFGMGGGGMNMGGGFMSGGMGNGVYNPLVMNAMGNYGGAYNPFAMNGMSMGGGGGFGLSAGLNFGITPYANYGGYQAPTYSPFASSCGVPVGIPCGSIMN